MRAIETIYAGCKFRSRLEARWAVFFDKLGVRWEYEPEGFDLGVNGWYLPDFYLPDLELYVEVKPDEELPLDEKNKIDAFGRRLWLVRGQPWGNCYPDTVKYQWEIHGDYWDLDYWLCICPDCSKIDIAYEGRAERICDCNLGDKGRNYDDPKIIKAATIAKQARFDR